MLQVPSDLGLEYVKAPLEPQTRFDLLIWEGFSCGLHWLYKLRFDETYKLPFSKDIQEFNRPLGELFNSTLRIIEYTHLYSNTHSFSHPLERFQAVSLELWSVYFDLPNGSKALHAKKSEPSFLA